MAIGPDFADVAAEQWGLITTAQARAVGGTPQAMAKLANQGILERLTHGVYRLYGVAPDPLDDLRAAWLAADPSPLAGDRLRGPDPAVVSHRSAASIHDLGDLEADRFEFTRNGRQRSNRADVRFHRLDIRPGDWRVVDGLPVTTVPRTIRDLAEAHIDGGHLASVVRDALTKHGVDADQLAQILAPYARRYGVRMGDGQAILARFLQEAGVSEPAVRAVELASSSVGETKTFAQAGKSWENMVALQETILSRLERIDPKTMESVSAMFEAVQRIPDPVVVKNIAEQVANQTSAIRSTIDKVALPSFEGIRVAPALEHLEHLTEGHHTDKGAGRSRGGLGAQRSDQRLEKHASASSGTQRPKESSDQPDTD